MLLVHPKRDNPDHWEVKWTWMPFFLAADTHLHKQVDVHLTARFGNADMSNEYLPFEMHRAVIDFVVEKYQFPGLKAYLDGIMAVSAPVEPSGA